MDDITELAAELGRRLQLLNAHVTTAESCTGGGIAEAITRIPGSSAWFEAGFVTYSNRQKTQQLDVPTELFEKVGRSAARWSKPWFEARSKKPSAFRRGGQRRGRAGRGLAEQAGGHGMAGLGRWRGGDQRAAILCGQP